VLVPSDGSTRLLMKIVTERMRWWTPLLAVGDWPMARRHLLTFKELAEASLRSGGAGRVTPG